jgi:small subunit ribosomal protein S2
LEKRHPGRERYIHSKRNGKWILDRDKSVEQLGMVLKRVEQRMKKKESVMVVGTKEELGRVMERVFADVDSKKRIRVSRTWRSGMLTNYTKFQKDVIRLKEKQEERKSVSEKRWYDTHRKGREGLVGREKGSKGGSRPGLILFRHPNDHGVGRKEARRCGIPTAGIVDTDCVYTDRLTYPIPGNDDSRRSQIRLMRRRKNVVEQTV